MIEIKIGEKHPLECGKCEDFMGYQVSDYVKTHFYMCYKPDGEFNNAFYGDYQPRITEGVTAFCMNCATKLKFKVRR